MKTIINVEVMAIDFPAEVEFHYSEDCGHVVNVYRIDLGGAGYCKPCRLISLYYKSDDFREIINKELKDKYIGGEYED